MQDAQDARRGVSKQKSCDMFGDDFHKQPRVTFMGSHGEYSRSGRFQVASFVLRSRQRWIHVSKDRSFSKDRVDQVSQAFGHGFP